MQPDFHLFHAYICSFFYYNINYWYLAETHDQKPDQYSWIKLAIVSTTYLNMTMVLTLWENLEKVFSVSEYAFWAAEVLV